MSRRAERRRFAVIGVLAEWGALGAHTIAATAGISIVDAINDLTLLEKQGRVVSERTMPLVLGAPGWIHRLPTDEERRQTRQRLQTTRTRGGTP